MPGGGSGVNSTTITITYYPGAGKLRKLLVKHLNIRQKMIQRFQVIFSFIALGYLYVLFSYVLKTVLYFVISFSLEVETGERDGEIKLISLSPLQADIKNQINVMN